MNPISSPRFLFGTFILAMLAGLGAYTSLAKVRLMFGSFLVGLVAVFPLADAFRRSSTAVISRSDIDPIISLTTGDFDAFAQINNTLLYVDRAGYSFGRQLIGVLSGSPGIFGRTSRSTPEFCWLSFAGTDSPTCPRLCGPSSISTSGSSV